MIYQLLSLRRAWGCDLGRRSKVPWLTPCSHAAPSAVRLSLSPHALPSYSTILMNTWLWQLSKNVGQSLCGQLDLSHLVIRSLCSLDSDPSTRCGDNLSNSSLVFFILLPWFFSLLGSAIFSFLASGIKMVWLDPGCLERFV